MSDSGARRLRLAALAAVPAAIAAGVLVPALAATPTGTYPTNYCPHGDAVLVHHTDGSYVTYQGPTALQQAINNATSTPPNSAGSGSGDTVIGCPGVFTGPITIDKASGGGVLDNVTVRSFDGPHDTTIIGDGSATPVVTIDANGVTFGGQVHGFNVVDAAPQADVQSLVGIELGQPGAQDTSNEDETCPMKNPAGGPDIPTGTGCDQPPQAGVAINDQVVDNTFQNFLPDSTTFAGSVTAIEADNTINATIQQNLVQHAIGEHSKVTTLNGIVVGTTSTTDNDTFSAGTSTNINTALLDNAIHDLAPGDNRCTGSTTGVTPFNVNAIELNGYVLDATVYANLVHEIVNDNSGCSAVGIYSNAFGTLENEQTGTLAPANINIDDNNIDGDGNHRPGTGVYLDPEPTSAQPQPQSDTPCDQPSPSMMTCTESAPPSSYTVTDNEFHDLGVAIDVESLLGANSYLRQNNFDNDVVGVVNDSTTSTPDTNLDATNDWWGCPDGPNTGGGCAQLVSVPGATSWEPPLRDHADHAGADAGNHAGEH